MGYTMPRVRWLVAFGILMFLMMAPRATLRALWRSR
jgi:hypothetical protein